MTYQIISSEDKRYKNLMNKTSDQNKDEEVFKMVDLQDGRVSYRENKLIIYDNENKAIVLSIFLPKIVSDPKVRRDDGMKKFLYGNTKSSSKHVIRIRYYTYNWIFICFSGSKAEERTNFLVEQYLILKNKKMYSIPIKMGTTSEYYEIKENLEESYEKIRCGYVKPLVFGFNPLPYVKYYAWMKHEKPGRNRGPQKRVVVQRRKSADYFKDPVKFEEYLVELGYDASTDVTVKSLSPKRKKPNSLTTDSKL